MKRRRWGINKWQEFLGVSRRHFGKMWAQTKRKRRMALRKISNWKDEKDNLLHFSLFKFLQNGRSWWKTRRHLCLHSKPLLSYFMAINRPVSWMTMTFTLKSQSQASLVSSLSKALMTSIHEFFHSFLVQLWMRTASGLDLVKPCMPFSKNYWLGMAKCFASYWFVIVPDVDLWNVHRLKPTTFPFSKNTKTNPCPHSSSLR